MENMWLSWQWILIWYVVSRSMSLLPIPHTLSVEQRAPTLQSTSFGWILRCYYLFLNSNLNFVARIDWVSSYLEPSLDPQVCTFGQLTCCHLVRWWLSIGLVFWFSFLLQLLAVETVAVFWFLCDLKCASLLGIFCCGFNVVWMSEFGAVWLFLFC